MQDLLDSWATKSTEHNQSNHDDPFPIPIRWNSFATRLSADTLGNSKRPLMLAIRVRLESERLLSIHQSRREDREGASSLAVLEKTVGFGSCELHVGHGVKEMHETYTRQEECCMSRW